MAYTSKQGAEQREGNFCLNRRIKFLAMESERQVLHQLNELIIKTSETLKLWQLMLEHQPNDVISHLKDNLRTNLLTWPFKALVENKDNVNFFERF